MSFLVSIGCGSGLHAKLYILEKTMPCFFSSKVKKKNGGKNVTLCVFEKGSPWRFWIFHFLQFFNHFWKKYITHIFFNTVDFCIQHTNKKFGWKSYFFPPHIYEKCISNHLLIFYRSISTCFQIKYLADLGKALSWFTNFFVIH